jgi:hypothetical protein
MTAQDPESPDAHIARTREIVERLASHALEQSSEVAPRSSLSQLVGTLDHLQAAIPDLQAAIADVVAPRQSEAVAGDIRAAYTEVDRGVGAILRLEAHTDLAADRQRVTMARRTLVEGISSLRRALDEADRVVRAAGPPPGPGFPTGR